ncbi:DeoR/GlpR family DNA-binding transcription regulator [Evansella sp. AB-rgal1]|uniref:DeoR/GlpR family DNA-binding transcription regulator n=1 Tax=Evansella sp. AB-rgal1 TaxID=3242696 RepID=UPI00359DD195
MLTFERQQFILSLLEEKEIVKIQELVDATNASESTIRRDLTELENSRQLKRIHGGAKLVANKIEEPTIEEKETKYNAEKEAIGEYAASLIKKGDSVFIDAGTTTKAMIPYLRDKDIVIVTNGLNILTIALQNNIKTYIVGGLVKSGTHAMIGRGAMESLQMYQFDKAFIGTNALDVVHGFTTPDPEEAHVKELAITRANKAFVVADHSKFDDSTFSKIADLTKATIITSSYVEEEIIVPYEKMTEVKVVDVK